MPNQIETRGMTCRELTVRSDSINVESRSFEAVVATESVAQVYDFMNGRVIDEILVATGGVFPESVVLLDNHQRYSGINSVMGTATNFRMDGNKWIGRGVVGKSVEGNLHREQAWMDIRDGHIRAVSIGYQVAEKGFTDIPPGQLKRVNGKDYQAGERTLRITTNWRVHELSLTPIGADIEAMIRSQSSGQNRPKKRSYFR